MMARLSLKYKLSQRYTNHSIRVTSLQVLENNNIEGRHAIRISGHKSDQSIKCYARRLSASRKRGISQIISSHVGIENPTFQMVPEQLLLSQTQSEPRESANSVERGVHFNIHRSPPSSTLTAAAPLPNNFSEVGHRSTPSSTIPVAENALLAEEEIDNEFFQNIPDNLLVDNSRLPPIILNRCNNCTINLYCYPPKTPKLNK